MAKQKTPACTLYSRGCQGKNDQRLVDTYCFDMKKCTHCPQRGGDDLYNKEKNKKEEPAKNQNSGYSSNNYSNNNKNDKKGAAQKFKDTSTTVGKVMKVILSPFRLIFLILKKIYFYVFNLWSKVKFLEGWTSAVHVVTVLTFVALAILIAKVIVG